jgi:hypothetical protein
VCTSAYHRATDCLPRGSAAIDFHLRQAKIGWANQALMYRLSRTATSFFLFVARSTRFVWIGRGALAAAERMNYMHCIEQCIAVHASCAS